MNRADSEAFAREWIAAWNSSYLDALLAHYTEDVTFASPRAEAVTGSATVAGSTALRAYWSAALQRATSRRFTLDHVVWDDERSVLVIVYLSAVDGVRVRACEIMRFDTDGRIVAGEALYGARPATG